MGGPSAKVAVVVAVAMQCGGSIGSARVAGGGGGGGSVVVAASLAALRQRGGSAASLVVALLREVRAAQRWRWRQCIDGGGQCVGSTMEADIPAAAAPTAVLPPVEVKISILC